MNIFMQLGIGLGAVTLVIWLCLLLKKQKRWWNFVYAGVVTAACATTLFFGFIKNVPEKGEATAPLTREEWATFAYSFAECGAYEEAASLMEDYEKWYGYDDTYRLFQARMYALQGEYVPAEGIYKTLLQTEAYGAALTEEYNCIHKKGETDTGTAAMLRYLLDNGKNPAEYGYQAEEIAAVDTVAQKMPEDVTEAVFAGIAAAYDTDDFAKEVSYVLQAEELLELYGTVGAAALDENEIAEIKEVLKPLNKLKSKGKGAALTGCVKDAVLGLNLLLGDYEAVVENIDGAATYTELMVAAELYMMGAVTDKDFSETYLASFGAEAEAVGKQLKTIYAAEKRWLEDDEAEELEEFVQLWKMGLKYPALTVMKTSLEKIAREKTADTEVSKVYLALAKIEHFYENDKNRKENITEAINTGNTSSDSEYSSAMGKLYDIIHNNEDTAEIMQVPDYVEKALEHALPTKFYELFSTKNQDGLQLYARQDERSLWQEENEQQEEAKDKEKELTETKKDFSQVFVEYVGEVKSSIGIGYIDVDAFDTVKARINISSEYATDSKKLREILSVSDCGLEISDFTIEKIEHAGVYTHLVCDVSGSMDSSIYDLRDAVVRYINGRGSKEQLALSTFSSYIMGTMPFGSSDSELLGLAQSMNAFGGTAIYNTLIEILQDFDAAEGSNNVIILMTDGEDGYRASYETIAWELAQLATQKNVTIYTLGLGYVDTEYLSAIAKSGRGDFIYVSDSTSLDNFYELLHSQVDNQYLLTYRAKDTLTGTNRTLEVKIGRDNVSDVKTYSILENVDDGFADSSELKPTKIRIDGISTRTIHKSNFDVHSTLLGEGFMKEQQTVIRLLGETNYTLELSYGDKNLYHFIIPAEVAVGIYDVEVTIDGQKTVLQDALTVVNPTTNATIAFGPYVFTAMKRYVNASGGVALSGNVVMNDWLHFKGDIVIYGDWERDVSIRVKDMSGSFVAFDTETAIGLGKQFAKKGMSIDIPPLNEFVLYYDANHLYDFDEYQVSNIRTPFLQVMQLVNFDSPFIKLYPDRIELEYSNAEPSLPFQDEILNMGKEKFEVEWEGSAVLNQQNFGMVIEVKSEGKNPNYRQCNLFSAPVYVSADDLELKIDTFKEEYAFGAMVHIAFLDCAAGARAAFKGFTIDEFSITVDKDVNTTMSGIPITFSKFKLGAEDVADALKNRDFTQLKIVGGVDIAAAKVSAFFPKFKKYVGDVSAFSMPETEVTLDLSPLSFSAEAKLMFLEKIQLLKAKIEVGEIEDYTNELLELDKTTVSGIRAELGYGINWEIDNCKVDISSTGEFDALNRFFGIQFKDAGVRVDLKWWLFTKHIDKEVDGLLGFYTTEKGKCQFMIILSQEGLFGKRSKTCFYINENGKVATEDNMKKIK